MRDESHVPILKGDGHVGGTGDDGGDRVVGGCGVVQFGGGEGRHDDAPGNESDLYHIQIQATFLFQCFERTLIFPEPFSELFRFITWIRKVQSNRNSPRTQTDSLPIGSASPVSVSHQQATAQASMLKV